LPERTDGRGKGADCRLGTRSGFGGFFNMAAEKSSIAQCAEIRGPDADGFVWLRLVRRGEDDAVIALPAESAKELLRWRDVDHHTTAECAEVVGPDANGKIWLNLVAGGKKTQVEVHSDQARDLLRWRDRFYERAERTNDDPRGNLPPPAEDQSG
jgi:hypothetical protein